MAQIHGGDDDGDGTNDGGEVVTGESYFHVMPEDSVSCIISFTTPRDACVVSSVSKMFKSAAQSDVVWERFLPSDYSSLVPQSLVFSSKKELYLALSDNPVLIDDGKKSFWLEKPTGKKCYMISALDLTIIWGGTPSYWQWISVPESRFERVAELLNVCWLEIRGKIGAGMLSLGTLYSIYFVFKTTDRWYGFDKVPVEAGVGVVGSEASSHRLICFDAGRGGSFLRRRLRPWIHPRVSREEEERSNGLVEPKERGDGWMEVELGEFFNNGNGDEIVAINVLETKGGNWKSGLIVQGIEIRPKEDGNN
ncbi:PREDICTED: F-box protein PP2-B1 [Tarenaya hassleriana]|uniref:F-box protein PP2-B1 n=1 Tax=Tarenaya hassleriana TaxID=28532 RepID=UPI00053C2036|nr:PREDICTED: F-box protein PP2-B1 [Tarenaya hassleriana]